MSRYRYNHTRSLCLYSENSTGELVNSQGRTREEEMAHQVAEFQTRYRKYKVHGGYPCLSIRYGRWGKSATYWDGICLGCGKPTRKYLLLRLWCEYVAKRNRKPRRCSGGFTSMASHPLHQYLDVPCCSQDCKSMFVFKYGLA